MLAAIAFHSVAFDDQRRRRSRDPKAVILMKLQTHHALFFLLLAGACGDDHQDHDPNPPSCEEDTRHEPYVAGIAKTGPAGYTLTLLDSNPAPPNKGDNVWTVEVTDPAGLPVPAITVQTVPFMPDHGHGTPIVPVVTDQGDGVYLIDPVNLFMPGFWEIELTATDDDQDLDTVTFNFCIEG
jgi:hypothetical protein